MTLRRGALVLLAAAAVLLTGALAWLALREAYPRPDADARSLEPRASGSLPTATAAVAPADRAGGPTSVRAQSRPDPAASPGAPAGAAPRTKPEPAVAAGDPDLPSSSEGARRQALVADQPSRATESSKRASDPFGSPGGTGPRRFMTLRESTW